MEGGTVNQRTSGLKAGKGKEKIIPLNLQKECRLLTF
jgi:hypothetical protein